MSDRKFRFRLFAEYESKDNNVSSLTFEHLVKHGWQEYDPRNYSAGFLMLLYALLNCQHMYFRLNAAERGIILKSSTGSLEAETSENWELQKLHIQFDAQVLSGNPSGSDKDYIISRMMLCPVSVNIKSIPDAETTINFV